MEPTGLQLLEVVPVKHNFKMHVTPEVHENYRNELFENFTLELLEKHLRKGSLFIDIGAHYGYYTLVAASKYPENRVIAFEPSPQNYEILKNNIAQNGFNNIESYSLALSDKNGEYEFFIAEHSDNCSFYEHPFTRTIEKVKVKTATLDSLIKDIPESHVVIKMDVEGHEISVLNGMTDLLKNSKNVELFIEFNPKMIVRSGNEPESLLRLIDSLGFDTFLIEDRKRETYRLRDSKDWNGQFSKDYTNGYVNLICIRKERALSVCIFSHTSQMAGAERSLIELTSELVRNHGVLCTAVIPGDGPLIEHLENAGASIVNMEYRWWCDVGIQSPDAIKSYYEESIHGLYKNIAKIAKINPDVILTNTMVIPWGAISALALDKPHVWYVREFGELDHDLKFYLPFQDVVAIMKTSNQVIANSEAVNRAVFKEYSGNVATIYNNVNIPQADSPYDNTEYFTVKDATRLIIAGHISRQKGQIDAVLAIRELIIQGKPVELIILGEADQEYLIELKELIRANSLETNIKIIDFQKNPYAIIKQADIVLVCSRNEAFGRTIAEAWLFKKPVIATNSGGIPELIRDGFNGLLYHPGDYKKLAQQICYLIENKDSIDRLGNNGYDQAKSRFTEDKYGGEVYRNLIKLKNNANRSATPLSKFGLNIIGEELQVKVTESIQKDEEINRVTSVLQARETEIRQNDESIKSLACELNSMKNSRIWRAVVKYQSVVDCLMPQGTDRRNMYDRIFMGLKKT